MNKKVSKLDKLIAKYLTRESTKKELEDLYKLLKEDVESQKVFEDFIKINVAADIMLQEFDSKKTKQVLLKEITKNKRKEKTSKVVKFITYAAAAILAGALFTTIFFKSTLLNKTNATPTIGANIIKTGSNKATLSLEDGSLVVLESGKKVNLTTATSNGKELTYVVNNDKKDKLIYNSLTIPRGGKFVLQLADGTKVWLNSESKLKYPVQFKKGETRSVELVYGEAYFDVSSNEDNNGDDFSVITKQQKVDVLGTEFNIKAYKDEDFIYSTLVEGHIVLKNGKISTDMQPGQQAILNITSNLLEIIPIDVYSETSWKKGLFSFKNMDLKNIMTVLSRWYDVKVEFTNSTTEKVKFNGVLSKNQNLDKILSTIQTTGFIKSYKIENKKVTIE